MATIEERLVVLEQMTSQTSGAIDASKNGVTGDGVTSDSAKIQELLDRAKPAVAGVEIYFGPGTYRLTSELKIYSNTKIVASPTAVFVRDHSLYLMMNGNRPTEPNPSNASGYTGRGNLTIIGGVWDGNGVKQKGKASIFHMGHGDKLHVFWAIFKDVSTSHHIEFNACRNIVVRDCFFLGMANIDANGETFNECIQLDISKSSTPTIAPGDQTPCRHVMIDNCYFGPSDTPGSNNIGRAVGSHTSTITRPHFDVTIKNCTVEDAQSWTFRPYNWRHVVIKNNVLYNCAAGINWRAAMSDGVDSLNPAGVDMKSEVAYIAEISGNTIQGVMNGGRAIEIYGESGTDGTVRDVIVSKNIIRLASSTREAILFHYAENCECVGNRIHGSGGSSVLVRKSEDITVDGNKITSAGRHGIEIAEGSNGISIGKNVMRKLGLSGISLADVGTEGVAINANVITGVNGDGISGGSANHIRMSGSVKAVSITGNVLRNLTGYTTTHGIYATSTCADVSTAGNVMPGLRLYNGATLSSGLVKDANGDLRSP